MRRRQVDGAAAARPRRSSAASPHSESSWRRTRRSASPSRDAGYRVVLSPVVVSNVIERRTLGRALDRQVRWGKIRYAFSKSLFAGELLMNPFPVALLAALLAVPGGSPWAGPVSSLALVSLLLRILQASLLGRICGTPLRPVELLAMPLKDLLQLATQAVPFVSKEVVWHGHRARIGKGTVLVEVERPGLLEAA